MAKFTPIDKFIWPLVVLVVALVVIYTKPWQLKAPEVISVIATGKTEATPNVAKITASVNSQNKNADAARRENEIKTAQIIESLKTLGIGEKDIKTQSISSGVGYEPQTLIYPARPRPSTNSFSLTLEITIHNFDNADEVIANLTKNGASNIYGPNLTIDDKALEEAKAKAREDGVNDAKNKAEQLAKLSNRKLGKVLKVEEQGDFGIPTPLMASSEMDLREKASQIQPGQSEVTVSLKVDYQLK